MNLTQCPKRPDLFSLVLTATEATRILKYLMDIHEYPQQRPELLDDMNYPRTNNSINILKSYMKVAKDKAQPQAQAPLQEPDYFNVDENNLDLPVGFGPEDR